MKQLTAAACDHQASVLSASFPLHGVNEAEGGGNSLSRATRDKEPVAEQGLQPGPPSLSTTGDSRPVMLGREQEHLVSCRCGHIPLFPGDHGPREFLRKHTSSVSFLFCFWFVFFF